MVVVQERLERLASRNNFRPGVPYWVPAYCSISGTAENAR